MKKLAGILMLSMAFALFAQEEVSDIAAQEPEVAQEAAEQEIKPAPAPVPVIAVKEEPVPAPIAEKKEEKKSEYPKIKQSGGVSFIPRMEVYGSKDSTSSKVVAPNANQRRLMFGWSYKLSVAVNDKLDLNFRLSDPVAEAGTAIAGSGSNIRNMLYVYLPNAYFTWKPVKVFNFSGGLLNVASSYALDLESSWALKNPTQVFGNTYYNSLAGLDFTFPITSSVKAFVTAGIFDNSKWQTADIANNDLILDANGKKVFDNDTIKSHSNGKIIIGADLSFADKKISVKPSVNIRTRSKAIIKVDTTVNGNDYNNVEVVVSQKPIISEGIDLSFKIAKPFSLNANVAVLHENNEEFTKNKENYTVIGAGIEPIFTFGGENGKLFTARVKYAFDIANNNADSAVTKLPIKDGQGNVVSAENYKGSFTNHIDARFAIAVNEKLSITPRLRYWSNNGANWYDRALKSDRTTDKDGKIVENKSAKSLARWEIGFAASF